MRYAHSERNSGFTLIEILVVIAIMTVIAGLLVAAAIGARRKVTSDRAKAGVKYIAGQIEAYLDKRGQLPPDTDANGFTTEPEIYRTLGEWSYTVSEGNRVDPWGNPYVIVLGRDYGVSFPIASGGSVYSTPPYDRIGGMYAPPPVVPADGPKEIHTGDPAVTPAHNDMTNGFQVISAGPDGYISRNGTDDASADNFTNW
ncbi:MAG: type II secretion system protein [Planctomycetota bacterium]|jgi:general secretion pathway protein G